MNNALITHAGPQFYILFGELVPPIVTSSRHLPDQIVVEPRARIAMAPEAMLDFARALQDSVERFLASIKQEEEVEIDVSDP